MELGKNIHEQELGQSQRAQYNEEMSVKSLGGEWGVGK